MKRILILATAFWLMTTAAVFADTHLIAVSQDEAEAVITVDGEEQTVELDAGMNCMTYEAEAEPSIEIQAFGDIYRPMAVKGQDGEWYAFEMIAVPRVEGSK